MKFGLILPLALALGACQTFSSPSLSILSANADGISYRVKADRVPDAEAAAAEYCRSRGRTAQLDRVSPVDDYANASFVCR